MTNYPWNRYVMPFQYAQSLTGAPVGGALLYFYASGTATPLDTYSDQALTIPNTNPVVADQYGVFPAIFLSNASYRVVLTAPPSPSGEAGAEYWTADPVSPFVQSSSSLSGTIVLECTVDGNGSSPTAPAVVGDLYVPFGCTITSAVAQSIQSGDLSVDVWVAPFVTNTPPTISDSIVASAPVSLSTSVSSIDTTLTGWSKTISAGSAVRFYLNSISSIQHFTISLTATLS